MRWTEQLLILSLLAVGVLRTATLGANVTHDHRALVIDGRRRVLISGSIHYPRSTPDVTLSLSLFLNFLSLKLSYVLFL